MDPTYAIEAYLETFIKTGRVCTLNYFLDKINNVAYRKIDLTIYKPLKLCQHHRCIMSIRLVCQPRCRILILCDKQEQV
jgi:hypothetical protein